MRSKEVLALQRDTVEFEQTHVRMFLQGSKTDQYREGHWVEVATVPGEDYCPGKVLRRLLDAMSQEGVWEGPLFRASQRLPGGSFVLKKGAMAYDTLLRRQKAAARGRARLVLRAPVIR